MAKVKRIDCRVLSLIVIMSMFFTMISIPANAVDIMDKSGAELSSSDEVYTNTLNEWSVKAVWGESDDESLIYYTDEDKTASFKLTFTYFLNSASRDYAENEVKFTLKGIGDVGRSSLIEAQTTTTQINSDWTLKYDANKDEYTFIYKKSIPENQTISGGFQVQWDIKTRAALNGYTYTSSPTFSDGQETINLPPLHFEYYSERDIYSVEVGAERLSGGEIEELEAVHETLHPAPSEPVPDDYVSEYTWYRYVSTFTNAVRARGLDSSDYFVAIDIENDENLADEKKLSYSDIIAYNNSYEEIPLDYIIDPATGEKVYGFYQFEDKRGTLPGVNGVYKDSFILGVNSDKLENNKIILNTRLIPIFDDETEEIINEEDYPYAKLTDTIVCTLIDYGFVYSNYNYWHGKTNASATGRNLVNDFYGGKRVTFELRGSATKAYTSSSASLNSINGLLEDEEDSETNIYPAEDETFSFIMGDDHLYALLRNGDIRHLEADEYSYKSVYVEEDGYDYDYDIYVAYTVNAKLADYTKVASGNTSEDKVTQLPNNAEGVSPKGVYIEFLNVIGTYVAEAEITTYLKFDWAEEKAKPTEEQINPDGNIVNVSYMRLLNKNGINFGRMYLEHYSGYFRNNLAPLDLENYGDYIYRALANVYLRSPQTNITSSTVFSTFKQEESGAKYTATIESSGNISADESGSLKKFSLYSVIPKGLYFDESLSDIVLTGSAHNLKGTLLGNEFFNDYVSFDIKTDNQGRKIIVANFDFSDNPIEISRGAYMKMQIPVYATAADFEALSSITHVAQSYTMIHDDGVEKVSGSIIQADVLDLDGNGDTTELLATSRDTSSFEVLLDEWKETAEKYVQTEYTTGYIFATEPEHARVDYSVSGVDTAKSLYSYRLDFTVGKNTIKDIVYYDTIEPTNAEVMYDGEKVTVDSKWQGTLLSVDTSLVEELGFNDIEVWYMTEQLDIPLDDFENTNPFDNSDNNWKSMTATGSLWTPQEGDTVRTIAVKIDPGREISDLNAILSVVVNMKAPERDANNPVDGEIAQNYYTVVCAQQPLTGQDFKNVEYKSVVTNVYIHETKPILKIIKVDSSNKSKLEGAKFTVYYDEECTDPVENLENVVTNKLGYIQGELPHMGDTYYIKEIEAPYGYSLNQNVIQVTANQEVNEVTVSNERVTGTAVLHKKDIDDSSITDIAGAVYELYTENGEKVYSDDSYHYAVGAFATNSSYVTTDSGLTVKGLPWGNYYFKEITAPKGYELNEELVYFSVLRRDESNGVINVETEHYDEELTASISITKTDAVDNTVFLRGARYNIERFNGTEWVVVRNNLVTNARGVLTVDGLKFGEYRFVEIVAPQGYELSTNLNPKSVTLNADTVGQTFYFAQSDQQKTGSTQLMKVSDTGTPIAGAVFSLYKVDGVKDDSENRAEDDPQDLLIKNNIKTGTDGFTEIIDELEWGDYYFVETKAATGYSKESITFSPQYISITPENVDIMQEVKACNNQILGSVTLTKYDIEQKNDANRTPLANAVFSLYDKDDKLILSNITVGTYNAKTGEKVAGSAEVPGTFTVTDLPWGSYYFLETTAPDGYALADKVRFTVNSQNCLTVQQLECYDEKLNCEIVINKKIDEVLEQFGNPTFLFKIKGTDAEGNNCEWLRSVTLSKDKTADSIKLSVPPGEYTVEEIPVSRYELVETEIISDTTTTGTFTDDVFSCTLNVVNSKPDKVEVSFENHLKYFDKFGYVANTTNIIPVEKKITGISVEYIGELIPLNSENEISEHTIDKKTELKLTLIYDDGTTELVDPSEFDALLPKDGSEGDEFTVQNGSNHASEEVKLDAQYTVDGKIYTTDFIVTISPAVVMPIQKVIYMVDENNESYFDKDGKRPTANVVYYSNGAVKSGEYLDVTLAADDMEFICWQDEKGNEFAKHDDVITYLNENADITTLTLTAIVDFIDIVTEIGYTGDEYQYVVPVSGYYKLEVWGASGGDGLGEYYGDTTYSSHAGHGGYSIGYTYLNKDEVLYVYVGGQGNYGSIHTPNNTASGGYNGGGRGGAANAGIGCGGGGGMTHISTLADNAAIHGQTWDYTATLIVAGGGGGADNPSAKDFSDDGSGGYGGGESGGGAYIAGGEYIAYAGTQTTGNARGLGANSTHTNDTGGGGGGWYGGKATNHNNGGGGGGSGYVDESLRNAQTIAGNEYVPFHNGALNVPEGAETMLGNLGDGYSIITYVGRTLD